MLSTGGANVLVLDEATSALDNESERFLRESINALAKNMTVIIITHSLSNVMKADWIYVIEGGSVVEEGDHKSLRGLAGRFVELEKAGNEN